MKFADELSELAAPVLLRPRTAKPKRREPAASPRPHAVLIAAVTYAELQVFHDPSPDGSGYSGVEVRHNGSFRAKAFKELVSPDCRHPSDAARWAVAWWKSVYGEAWPQIYRARKIAACRPLRDKYGGGYRFVVRVVRTPGLPARHAPGLWWLKGSKTSGVRSRLPDYETRAEALDDCRTWAARTFGGLARLYLRSTEMPGFRGHRAHAGRPAGSHEPAKMTQ